MLRLGKHNFEKPGGRGTHAKVDTAHAEDYLDGMQSKLAPANTSPRVAKALSLTEKGKVQGLARSANLSAATGRHRRQTL